MEISEHRIVEMTSKICRTLRKNNDVLAIPEIGTATVALEECLDRINEQSLTRISQHRALTSKALEFKEMLISKIKFTNEKIDEYAASTLNIPIRAVVKISLSQLRQLSEGDLINKAKVASALIAQHKEHLLEFGYTQNDNEALAKSLSDFVAIVAAKKESEREIKENGSANKEIITEIKSILKNLDLQMLHCRYNFPDLFTRYKIDRDLKKGSSQKLSLNAYIADSTGATPLANVRVEFYKDEDELVYQLLSQTISNTLKLPHADIIKVTTNLGRFNIKQLAPGAYTALIRKNGYKTQVQKVYINQKKTFVLNFKMEKVKELILA